MSVDFVIDDIYLDNYQIYEYGKNIDGWKCHVWSTTLSDWKPGSEISLLMRISMYDDLDDGRDIYPQGTYDVELLVKVIE